MSSSTSIADSIRPLSIYEESIRTPQKWDSIYSQAAKVARGPGPLVDDNTPIVERNIRKTRRSHPPTSTRYFPVETGEPSPTKRDTSSTRSGPGSSGDGGRGRRASSIIFLDRFKRNSTEQDEPRGRDSSSYVQNTRQQSRDRSVSGMRDEAPVTPKRSESRTRWFFKSRSRARNSSRDAPSTIKPSKNEASTGDTSSSNPFADGLRVAVKAAFSKHSTAPDSGSPTESFVSAVEYPQTLRPEASKRALTTSVLDTKNNISAEQILGEAPPTLVQDFAITKKSNRKSIHPPSTQGNRPGKSGSSPSNSRNGHSRSVTDSSEEYSTLDDFLNITTPTLSRPQSEKGYFPPMDDIKTSNTPEASPSLGKFNLDLPLMSIAVFDDAASGRDSWCRTAVEMELTEDEDHMKTPTGKKSTDFAAAQSQEALPKPDASSLNRQPSLSRSVSTPELQDLSFLPALKHQALTKPQKGKGKGILGRKSKQASLDKETLPPPTSLIRPPPIQAPTTSGGVRGILELMVLSKVWMKLDSAYLSKCCSVWHLVQAQAYALLAPDLTAMPTNGSSQYCSPWIIQDGLVREQNYRRVRQSQSRRVFKTPAAECTQCSHPT
ncbi:hypothetical protein BKA61DRAFT_573511 [Leptodontidium sp. MPI-SDFR-AT-0119]|nr:hypothetical protein BKA61DRAFT_573511 [Leptodontidium sp. MPI-SDFR-AT-0119]